jgi:hypothetical protein
LPGAPEDDVNSSSIDRDGSTATSAEAEAGVKEVESGMGRGDGASAWASMPVRNAKCKRDEVACLRELREGVQMCARVCVQGLVASAQCAAPGGLANGSPGPLLSLSPSGGLDLTAPRRPLSTPLLRRALPRVPSSPLADVASGAAPTRSQASPPGLSPSPSWLSSPSPSKCQLGFRRLRPRRTDRRAGPLLPSMPFTALACVESSCDTLSGVCDGTDAVALPPPAAPSASLRPTDARPMRLSGDPKVSLLACFFISTSARWTEKKKRPLSPGCSVCHFRTISSVPLPWCTSQSTMATRRMDGCAHR